MSIRVLELRSVAGTGGGPEKTILTGAAIASPDIKVTVCYLANAGDDVFPIGRQAQAMGWTTSNSGNAASSIEPCGANCRRSSATGSIDIIHGHDYKTDLFAWLLARIGRPHGHGDGTWLDRSLVA